MQPVTLPSRVPITALADVESFLEVAQSLKATTLQLRERQQRESGYQRALAARIASMTRECDELAKRNARVREMWRQVKAELEAPKTEGA